MENELLSPSVPCGALSLGQQYMKLGNGSACSAALEAKQGTGQQDNLMTEVAHFMQDHVPAEERQGSS